MAGVILRNVSKTFGDVTISKDINLDINDGEFVVFVGPSGCGKSTLLRMIAGLEDITAGDLLIGEQRMNDVPPAERGVGMVFQSYALYPHLSVADNMSFGLKLAGTHKAEITQRVQQAADILQLGALLERQPKALSGGQRQRVAIGRTLVAEPHVFLLDEPLSNLDAALRVQMRIELARLHKRLGCTMIYVTHDQIEAMTLANKIVVLDGGAISQVGKPLELYHYPANQFVAGFLGSPKMNFLPVTVLAAEAQQVEVEVMGQTRLWLTVDGANVTVGEPMTLGIRPEHLLDADNSQHQLYGEILVVEQLGNETQIHLQLPGYADPLVYRHHDVAVVAEGVPLAIGIIQSKHSIQTKPCITTFPTCGSSLRLPTAVA